jgi:SNF2 family DNA or RNA helicase
VSLQLPAKSEDLLLLTDVNDDLKLCLIEEYANEEKPSDGELYCKIRRYHFLQDRSLELRWMSRLSGNRKKNYNGLRRDGDLINAFDALLDITGLWSGMHITTLHKIMALKCDDVSTTR